ncbi:MAG: macro domain-containing protein [Lachnospiraceae bacterium]|nr:macro domain-containing protein [Lachnospiraceae bacterium]
MMPGQVAHTPAFNLSAKYIIHTIGPAWKERTYANLVPQIEKIP